MTSTPNTSRKNSSRISTRHVLAALMGCAALTMAGCAPVGPDYVPPGDNAPQVWHTELRQGLAAASLDPRVLARWWTTLDDPVLTSLVDQAVSDNLDLRQAQSRVREARARRGISQSALYPSLDASAAAARTKGSGSSASHESYALNLDASWELDIFGGTRRAVEAADADLAASQEDLRDVLVSLTAEVALNYLEARTLQKRITVAEGNLELQQQSVDLARARFQAGLSDELALQEAIASLESTRAQLPTLRTGLEAAKNNLALLAGTKPGGVHDRLATVRPLPVLPPTVAVGVPAETLRQRPDIRRAERNLAAQTARVGVATADLYPKFRLSGFIGLESIEASKLFNTGSEAWNITPGVAWNIFDAGAIRQNIEVQSARQEQSLLAYEGAILSALSEVENALTAFAEEQLRHQNLQAAVEATRLAEIMSKNQYQAGLVDFNTVLIAQRALLNLEDQLAVSSGAVTANLVRLYKALGGGWESVFPEPETGADKG